MKRLAIQKLFRIWLLVAALLLPNLTQAQLSYTTNDDNSIKITGYFSSDASIIIPSTLFWHGVSLPVTSIGTNAFQANGNVTSVTIGTNINNIGDYGFNTCYNLASVIIPNGVTNIGKFAFFGCRSMTSVTIGNSLNSIGIFAFGYVPKTVVIAIDTNNPNICSVDGLIFDKNTNSLIQCPAGKTGTYTIPNTVTNIAVGAFSSCFHLTNILIGANVINIGADAFWECGNLTNIVIPSGVINIGNETFYDCYKLNNISLGANITSIGTNAFYYCTNLSSIKIPSSVTNIGFDSFFFCTNLKSVYFEGNAPSTNSFVFSGDNNATVYYLPGTTGWSSIFAGRPTVLWNPLAQTRDASFGVRTNKFGFNITGTSGLVIVVEACTNFSNPIWKPIQTNTLISGTAYFSDPKWTNKPGCFYRIRSP